MSLHLHKSTIHKSNTIQITGSKSESNRLLLLQALYPEIKINNVSNSDDSVLMSKALNAKGNLVDIHHAGTAMRFLTAYFSTQEGQKIELTGSKRMKERPIAILVDALNQLGADITYTQNQGFPPLLIKGKKLTKNKVTLKANVSSQYISALLLIAPKLENGLELTLEGEITSVPYINMTLSLLEEIGIQTKFEDNLITIQPKQKLEVSNPQLTVESDWSSASYFYSIVAMSAIGTSIQLSSYKQNSLQGDSVLADIYKTFGVTTTFRDHTIVLQKTEDTTLKTNINFDLKNAPDIAQTIAVTAFGLGLSCQLTGLHTLKIKETDRLVALKTELEKLGGEVAITDHSLMLKPSSNCKQNILISTYNDHRMAMAFAPLALKVPIIIQDSKVVSKSYPMFWDDLADLGYIFSV